MEILLGFFIAIFGILITAAIRSLTTFFHEMGHAIPALLFTEAEVSVYIGTYGDLSKGVQFRVGRLQIYFRWNLLDWKIGMCSFTPQRTTWKAFLIILGGPLASLIISIPLLLIILNNDLSEISILFLSMFMMAATIDFVINMYPFSSPIYMHDGSVSYCDGYQLLGLFLRLFSSKEYIALETLYLEEKYQEVIDQTETLLEKKPKEIAAYYLAIHACALTENFKDGLWFYEQLKNQKKLQANDYRSIASFYAELNMEEEALKCLHHCIELQQDNPDFLSERSRILLRLGNYELALKDANLAIYYNPDDPNLIMLKGMLKIHLGNEPEGLQLLKTAEQLGEASEELFKFLVNYYQEKGLHEQAKAYQVKINPPSKSF